MFGNTELVRSLIIGFYFGTECHAGTKYIMSKVCIINIDSHTPHLLEQHILIYGHDY